MQITNTAIGDVVEITPNRFGDLRGYFSEVFKDTWFRQNVADVTFVQDNQSLSRVPGTLRGLHFQIPPFSQGKLVRVLSGSIFDVAVDIRQGSPTYGRWVGVHLLAEIGNQLWIPPGFAHGFATLVPDTLIHYKVTAPYDASSDRGLYWNDPDIGIEWPIKMSDAILSEKDKIQPLLKDISSFFPYSEAMHQE